VQNPVELEALHLDISPNLERLRCHPPPDVLHQGVLHLRRQRRHLLGHLLPVRPHLLHLPGQAIENRVRIRHNQLERLESVAVLAVQRPADVNVEVLEIEAHGLGDVAHDGVDELGLVEAILAGLDIFFCDAALGEVDVALVAVDAEDHDGFLAADLEERGDGADAAARELGEEKHAFDVVVLEEGNVGAHVHDVLHLDHHRHVHLGILGLVHAALEVGAGARRRHW